MFTLQSGLWRLDEEKFKSVESTVVDRMSDSDRDKIPGIKKEAFSYLKEIGLLADDIEISPINETVE